MKFDAADLDGSALQVAVDIIRKAGFFADVRGDALARFVYAIHQGRAAELYSVDDGYETAFFAESEESAVREDRLAMVELAADHVVEWLSGRI